MFLLNYFLGMILTSIMFTMSNHPILMILFLILTSLLIALKTLLMSTSTWLPLILILIFLGGMLILFIYIASLAPNEKFPLNKTPFLLLLILVPTLELLTPHSSSLPNNLYTNFPFKNTLFLAAYLFITLIAVVNLTKSAKAPLRMN